MQGLDRVVRANSVLGCEVRKTGRLSGFRFRVSTILIRMADELGMFFERDDIECFGHKNRIRDLRCGMRVLKAPARQLE